MNLDKLENLVYKEKIELVDFPMENTKARILQNTKDSFIFIDRTQIETSIEEKCILAEELGHYYCDALYSPLYYDKNLVSKNEYKAAKWAFKALINKEQLIALSKQNLTKYEVSEELGVTEELLEKAYDYYMYN